MLDIREPKTKEDQLVFPVPAATFDKVWQTLENPPAPSKKLKTTMQAKAPWE